MAGDSNYASVGLLLHCDGANNSTVVTDNSITPQALTVVGNAKISTIQSKFGGSSLAFDGTGDYVYVSDSMSVFKPGTADFTIEMWIYTTSLAAEQGLCDLLVYAGTGSRTNALVLVLQTTGKLNFYANSGYHTASSGTISINTWTKVTFVRISGVFKYFINGTLDANTDSTSVNLTSGGMFIGGYADGPTGNFNGYIDEFRYTKGLARYTANFTPETAAFVSGRGQLSGNITESLAITDWTITAQRCSDGAYERVAYSSGATYTIDCATLEPHVITVSPRLHYAWSVGKTTALNDYVVAVNPDGTPHLWKCTTAGTTHATTEPPWNLSGTTTDNTVTWTYVAPLVDPVSLSPKIPS